MRANLQVQGLRPPVRRGFFFSRRIVQERPRAVCQTLTWDDLRSNA
jgi:hypothetical protein